MRERLRQLEIITVILTLLVISSVINIVILYSKISSLENEKYVLTMRDILEYNKRQENIVNIYVTGNNDVIEIESDDEEKTWVSMGEFDLTAYCPCEICCGAYSNGITASGTVATAGRTIAADTDILPMGSHVMINGHEYVVEDRGGAIKGNHIDIFYGTHDEALGMGIREAEVYILKEE